MPCIKNILITDLWPLTINYSERQVGRVNSPGKKAARIQEVRSALLMPRGQEVIVVLTLSETLLLKRVV